MAEVDTGPLLQPTDTLQFVDSHRPTLDDGIYSVSVEHTLDAGGQTVVQATRSMRFAVTGPRLALAPTELGSRFPPPGSTGDFAGVLPHLLLRRPTLPWERSALAPDAGRAQRDGPPWLALLVLTPDEILETKTVPAGELLQDPTSGPPGKADPFERLPRSPGDDPKQPVVVITIDAALARKILPSVAELELASSVRLLNGSDGRALLVATRLPAPGTPAAPARINVVHLVSLERQFRRKSTRGKAVPAHWLKSSSTTQVRLVSLAQWSFACRQEGSHLDQLLTGLQLRQPKLESKGLGASAGPVEVGAVPLAWNMADGRRTAAWYHGPLASRDMGVTLPLPARQADDLLLLERATGMPDISYAAAWQLGRLLALRDPGVGVRLNQWKRQVAHAALMVRAAALPGAPTALSPLFPLDEWFDRSLSLLTAVPFCYLVADPDLLPTESLCTFRIDPHWIDALFDGAFSIGRHDRAQQAADSALRAVLPKPGQRSGLLLRSQAVAGWPDLVVEGIDSQGATTEPLRFERLAADTLLVLFAGLFASIRVHPYPQAMHVQIDLQKYAGWIDPQRKLAIGRLASDLGASGASGLAKQLLENGVPRFTFGVSP